MVFLKALGMIDIAMAILIGLTEMGLPLGKFYLLIMLLHAGKAIFFIKDILSLLDLIIVAYTMILPFWSHPYVSIIIIVFLFLKGVYSFV